MAISVKICGLKTEETIDAAIRGGASHVGFIFFEKSPRNVDTGNGGPAGRTGPGAGQDSGRHGECG